MASQRYHMLQIANRRFKTETAEKNYWSICQMLEISERKGDNVLTIAIFDEPTADKLDNKQLTGQNIFDDNYLFLETAHQSPVLGSEKLPWFRIGKFNEAQEDITFVLLMKLKVIGGYDCKIETLYYYTSTGGHKKECGQRYTFSWK